MTSENAIPESNYCYTENCLDTMRRMENGKMDMILTSPPYDDLRNYKGYSFDFKPIAREIFRITKDGGIVVWIVGDQTRDYSESGSSFKQAGYFMDIGFKLYDTMIYQKNGFSQVCNVNAYWQSFEYMFILSKGKPVTTNMLKDRKNKNVSKKINGEYVSRNSTKRETDGSMTKTSWIIKEYGKRSNIWYYDTGLGHSAQESYAHDHPAIFPEALARDHILSWSNPGDLVYDPFMGSGTVAKMAEVLDRKWLGSEINPDYVKILKKRLMQTRL